MLCLYEEQEALLIAKIHDWSIMTFENYEWNLSILREGFAVLFSYLFLMPIAVKRAHDIGHKGTIVLASYSIYVVIITYCINFGYLGWGPLVFTIGNIPLTLYGLILLFKDSQKGTNKYGTSTKYPDSGTPAIDAIASQQKTLKTWKEAAFVPGAFLLCVTIAFICIYVTPSQCALRELKARGLVQATAFGTIVAYDNPDHLYSANEYAQAPLHRAAEEGNLEVLKLLIQAGVPVNSTVYWRENFSVNLRGWEMGDTPLDVAYRFNQPEAVKLLLQAGGHTKRK